MQPPSGASPHRTQRSVERIALDAEQTQALGRALGRGLPSGAVLALHGELGAGKTTFVRGLAAGLGIDSDEVSSPTYTLMHQHSGRLELYHLDAWMAAREEAFLAAGGEEWLHAGGVAAIEWAERVVEYLPEPRLELRLEPRSEGGRRVTLALVPASPGAGASAKDLETRLGQALEGWERESGSGSRLPEPPAAPGVEERS